MDDQRKVTVHVAVPQPRLRDGIAGLCRHNGIAVRGKSSDLVMALEAISTLKPDIAVVDAALPSAGGLELARQLARGHCATKVLLLVDREPANFASSLAAWVTGGVRGYISRSDPLRLLFEAIFTIQDGTFYIPPRMRSQLDSQQLSLIKNEGIEADRDLTGVHLGHFHVINILGSGSMGRVYKAMDEELGRIVAIKPVPHDGAIKSELKIRFRKEALAFSKLNHPNVVKLFEIGHDEGFDFLVLEFVPGKTLHEYINGSPMPLADVLRFANQIAAALTAAHEANVIHRDVKPTNLMVTPEGIIKLLDFSLAKIESMPIGLENSTLTMTLDGLLMGTIGYMSPEQARGKPVDIRTDIFSFGVLLYEMLTGEAAFRRSTGADTLQAIIREPLPSVCAKNPALPAALDECLAIAVAKEPEKRYSSIHQFLTALIKPDP